MIIMSEKIGNLKLTKEENGNFRTRTVQCEK